MSDTSTTNTNVTVSENSSTMATAAAAQIDKIFGNLFPDYSQGTFARLLDGEISDGELSALGLHDAMEPVLVSEELKRSPGYQVACEAAALDGQTVVEEPLFFMETGAAPLPPTTSCLGQSTVDCNPAPEPSPTQESSVPPEDTAPSEEVLSENASKKRSLEQIAPSSDVTKDALKKAKRISFQSSCGGYLPVLPKPQDLKLDLTLSINDPLMPNPLPLKPNPIPADLVKELGLDGEPLTKSSVNVPAIESKPMSIVDALLETLAATPESDKKRVIEFITGDAKIEAPSLPATETNETPISAPCPATITSTEPSVEDTPPAVEPQEPATSQEDAPERITQSAEEIMEEALKHAQAFNTNLEDDSEQDCGTEQTKTGRKRMRYLSKEQKDKVCRDRNRVHARNTRLRKKAYLDELKKSINDLVDQRDTGYAMKERQAKIWKQNKDVRLMVIQNFLNLQAANVSKVDRWSTLLKDDITVTMPSRGSQSANVPSGNIIATGVEGVMTGLLNLNKALEESLQVADLNMSIQCDRKSFVMDGSTAVANLSIDVSPPNQSKLSLSGSLRARFCVQTNKIQSARLLVDFGTLFLPKC